MADSKITDLTALAVQPDSSDVLPIVDISDTSMAATGTTKKIAYSDFLSGYLTSATASSTYLPLAGGTLSGTLTSRQVAPSSDSTYTLGTSSLYWSNTYTDRLYLNSTAYLDGAIAGEVGIYGNIRLPAATAIYQGDFSLLSTKTRSDATFANVFLGRGAGGTTLATTGAPYLGTGNIGIGDLALSSTTTGFYNISIGSHSGLYLTTGRDNFFAGHTAGNKTTTGGFNFYMGSGSGFNNTTGSENIGIGAAASSSATTASGRVAIGHRAGYNGNGSYSVFLGYKAGYNETGSNMLYIANSDTSTPLIKGDFSANTIETPASIEITDTSKGVILKSPDGTRYRITVANGGTLNITAA